jgi:short-subunit dehydrogenase
MTITNKPKTIWLVGASSGIGKELALQLAAQGHKVIISARRAAELEKIAAENPSRILSLSLDVTDHSHKSLHVSMLASLTDHIDIFIYNSGTAEYISGNDRSYLESTLPVYDVNFFGFLYCLDLAIPLLKKASGKKLIAGVASLSTYLALPRAEAYGSSKAALVYFLDSLRSDIYEHNIDVTVINPGFVDTPLTQRNDFPMPWIWSSQQAASYIVKQLPKHKAEIRFPFLLAVVLRMAACLPKKFLARHLQFMVKN